MYKHREVTNTDLITFIEPRWESPLASKYLFVALLMAPLACHTVGGGQVLDEQNPPEQLSVPPRKVGAKMFDTPQGVPAPFGRGYTDGMFWEARFNLPNCDHPPHKKNAFCLIGDQKAAAAESGIEAELEAWASEPEIKSLQLAYFSFSDNAVIRMLCNKAETRGLKVNIYLHNENMGTPGAKQLSTCSPSNIKVIPRGTEFGSGYLQHAKVFFASAETDPKPLHMLPEAQRLDAQTKVAHFTSSSANMSSFGTSLHFDNWLFFTARTDEYLVQKNLCFFLAIANMETGGDADERDSFAHLNADCIAGIKTPKRTDLQFFPVPHGGVTDQIFPVLEATINTARTEIKMAADRLTTGKVYRPLINAAKRNVKVSVVLDDDTLRAGKCGGGAQIDQNGQDVAAMRAMANAGIDITFMETNGEISQLQHNKFFVADGRTLIQGAGNFTSTALNIFGPGNFEHYYAIQDPEIVKTYERAWDELRARSSTPEEHELKDHKDMPIIDRGNGPELDSSVCTI